MVEESKQVNEGRDRMCRARDDSWIDLISHVGADEKVWRKAEVYARYNKIPSSEWGRIHTLYLRLGGTAAMPQKIGRV